LPLRRTQVRPNHCNSMRRFCHVALTRALRAGRCARPGVAAGGDDAPHAGRCVPAPSLGRCVPSAGTVLHRTRTAAVLQGLESPSGDPRVATADLLGPWFPVVSPTYAQGSYYETNRVDSGACGRLAGPAAPLLSTARAAQPSGRDRRRSRSCAARTRRVSRNCAARGRRPRRDGAGRWG